MFKGHSGIVSCVDMNATTKKMVSASSDRTVKLWDMNKEDHYIKSCTGHEGNYALCFLIFDGEL